jgi:hypothetical protein
MDDRKFIKLTISSQYQIEESIELNPLHSQKAQEKIKYAL